MQHDSPFRIGQYLLMLIGVMLACISVADERGPVIPKGEGESCVADTDFMRRNHMDLIEHQRDETVIRGIRDEPFSLVECVDCHAQKDAKNEPIRIDAEGQFCASCHTFVAAKIDCFGCHAAVPDSDEEIGTNHWLHELSQKRRLLAFKSHSAPALNPVAKPSPVELKKSSDRDEFNSDASE